MSGQVIGSVPKGCIWRARPNAAPVFYWSRIRHVQRADLVASAREAADAGFDIVIACAFNFDAHTSEFRKLGHVHFAGTHEPDLLADDLRAGGGNLFIVLVSLTSSYNDGEMLRVELFGVDILNAQVKLLPVNPMTSHVGLLIQTIMKKVLFATLISPVQISRTNS